jgi:hypothetical protein
MQVFGTMQDLVGMDVWDCDVDIYIAFGHLRILFGSNLGFVLFSLATPWMLVSVLEICNDFLPYSVYLCSRSEVIGLKVRMISE